MPYRGAENIKTKNISAFVNIFRQDIPSDIGVKKICFVMTCNWNAGFEIEQKLRSKFQNARILFVLRSPHPVYYTDKDVIISTNAISITAKLEMIKELRKNYFDVVATCWNGEPTFGVLRLLCYLLKTEHLLIFENENSYYWMVRNNIDRAFGIIARLSFKYLKKILSYVFLFPAGILYVTLKGLYYKIQQFIFFSKKNK